MVVQIARGTLFGKQLAKGVVSETKSLGIALQVGEGDGG